VFPSRVEVDELDNELARELLRRAPHHARRCSSPIEMLFLQGERDAHRNECIVAKRAAPAGR
jgi:hypothetical protein